MEHIVPAFSSCVFDDKTKLSSEEFQQQLYSCFQEKGMITDLKSYLKHQMVNVLRSTPARKTISKHIYPLHLQAFNFLIGEHLIQHHCYYSFSVFSTEADIINILPDTFSSLFNSTSLKSKLEKENIINILELIGVPKNSPNCTKVLKKYNSNEGSLLSCLIDIFITEDNNRDNNLVSEVSKLDDDAERLILEGGVEFKSHSEKRNQEVISEIKSTYDVKLKETKVECDQLTKELKNEIYLKEQQILEFSKLMPVFEDKLTNISVKYRRLKNTVQALKNEKKELKEQVSTAKACSLQHCSEKCKSLEHLSNKYENENHKLKSEIELLTDMTSKHKFQYQELRSLYNDIAKEIEVYKSKVHIMTSKFNTTNEGISSSDFVAEKKVENAQYSSDNTQAEVICYNSMMKLSQLEKESIEQQINLLPS